MATWICLLVSVCSAVLLVQARSAAKELKMEILRDVLAELKEIPALSEKSPDVQTAELGTRISAISRQGREFLRTRQALPASCTEEYEALPDSTMCAFWDSPNATNSGVSSDDVELILAEHNRHRSSVIPTATNMLKMYYDEEIAKIAQKYATVCPDGHDSFDNRQVPGYGILIGQNLAWGHASWEAAITAWHAEVSLFTYQGTNNVLSEVGHYTQVVNANAVRIGCGYAQCSGRHNYVCNYAYGQMTYEIDAPYTSGASCAACPDHCSDNMCDCGDILCRNGGTIDRATCSCVCENPYSGHQCEGTSCPFTDPSHCGGSWPPSYCQMYTNVPESCPIMCGICPDVCPGFTDDSCQNGGVLNSACECDCPEGYSGDQCQTADNCPVAEDVYWCPWIEDWWCGRYSNMPTDCPYRCGFC